MTDIRLQNALNSLVKIPRRQALDGALEKPPVLGGVGNAGASEPRRTALDQVYGTVQLAVELAGEPDTGIPTYPILTNMTSDPVYVIAIDGDIYTVHRAGGFNRTIQKNGAGFLSGFSQIGDLSGNTTQLVVLEIFSGGGAAEVQFRQKSDGGLIRTFANTADWQTAQIPPRSMAANDTRWALTIENATSWNDLQGFWLYDGTTDAQVAFIAKPNQNNVIVRSDVAFMPDRFYTIWRQSTNEIANLDVYDIDGTLLDGQTFDTTGWNNLGGYEWMEVTHKGLWLSAVQSQRVFVSWLPRIDSSELFDPASRLEIELQPGATNPFSIISKDRDFTLEY